MRRSIRSLGHFEGDARAAQCLARIRTARLIGIDHGQRSRNALRAGKMMVGDDQVHAQPSRGLRRSKGADAHVHADDELDAGAAARSITSSRMS